MRLTFRRQTDLPAPGTAPDVPPQDHDEALLDTLERYVTDGCGLGQRTVLFATHERTRALRRRLAVWGLEDCLETHDAADNLKRLMVDGRPSRERFDKVVGAVLRAHEPGAVRAYCDMSAVLWQQGNRHAALELEQLCDELLAATPVPMMCSYPGSGFDAEPVQDAVLVLQQR